MKLRFWTFMHHCVAHPVMGLVETMIGYAPDWAERFHSWTVPMEWRRAKP